MEDDLGIHDAGGLRQYVSEDINGERKKNPPRETERNREEKNMAPFVS